MRKRFWLLVVLVTFSLPSVYAQTPADSPATREDILKLFNTMKIHDQMRLVMDSVVKQQREMIHDSLKKHAPQVTAEDLARLDKLTSDIVKDGRAVFYGIQFDFDKADIKPESEPQLAEMAKAIKADPKLKVLIVGHTDNAGKLDYNTALSQRRAEAVVKILTAKYGIDAKRMAARGIASLAPIATNRTDEGRAKNRRVEMVEQ